MDTIDIYVNLIRVLAVAIAVVQICKHDYKKILPAALLVAITFVPWLFGLFDIKLNMVVRLLLPTVAYMSILLGSALRYYDRYAWWDRVVHFLSGLLFFSLGISLTQKAPGLSLAGVLLFSFCLSLAMHDIWEVSEFLVDSIFHTDHQHWQKHSKVINHQPDKAMQPPGLVDTMMDTIVGIIGAIVACFGWWLFYS